MDYTPISNDEKFKRLGLNISLYRKMKNMTQAELKKSISAEPTWAILKLRIL